MPGPVWNDDATRDAALLVRNSAQLVGDLSASATSRALPKLGEVLGWHSTIYTGCSVPVPGYIGHLRGDESVPELVGYEVGVGPAQADGLPEKVGVWSATVADQVRQLLRSIHAAVLQLDAALPAKVRPTTVAEIDAVIQLTAIVHGEWLRIHPFANGNGRTARAWTSWLALRYSLPLFVTVKPRPVDTAYVAAGKASMCRPPDFVGDQTVATRVFAHMLALSLLP